MTYLEKLFEAMSFISKRHTEALWTKELQGYDFSAKLTFIKQQPKDSKNDYEWILYSITGDGSIELRLDINSLATDLHLLEPEFICGFPSEGLNGPGIMFRISEEWNKTYRNAEYVQEDYEFPIPFWRCSDEFFKQRVVNFNQSMMRFNKKRV